MGPYQMTIADEEKIWFHLQPIDSKTIPVLFLILGFNLIHCNLYFDLTNINLIGHNVQYTQNQLKV